MLRHATGSMRHLATSHGHSGVRRRHGSSWHLHLLWRTSSRRELRAIALLRWCLTGRKGHLGHGGGCLERASGLSSSAEVTARRGTKAEPIERGEGLASSEAV